MPSDEAQRASPDALLALAKKEGRGHLKIFLGAAPGVGKTFAMLTSARTEKSGGRDVVAGLIETHGRRETEQLIDGFEVLPRKPIVYRNQVMKEFDLDAALARRPSLLLVDEYAHTNVPGSRHPKRWQDIDELLAAGIDVWTTLNIQHLESLNDVVLKITKVRVRETVPDTVFDKADEIILVDFPPDELLKRLAEGKVYVQDTAARAVESFFKPQNLTALRELALRRAAERIDVDLVSRMQAQAIEGPWAAGERILACIGPDPVSPTVVRTAKRLADLMDAPWIAVTVERPGADLNDAARRRRDDAMKLAEALGAETQTLTGSDLPAELLRFAKFENVTQIVIGRSHGGFFSELLRRSLPHELVRRTQDIAIHLVTRESEPAPRGRFTLRRPGIAVEPLSFLYATAAVAAALGVGELLTKLTPIPNLSMVFLMAVLLTAVSFGIWPAIYASVLSFLAYNFFFIEPIYTFTVAEPYELLALVIFLVVAVVTSALAGRVREQATISAEPHAGDAAALRIHPPAVGAGDVRCRGRRRGQRNPRQPRPRGGGAAGAGRRSGADRRLAAGRRARRRADDGGALGLQPRRAGGRRYQRRCRSCRGSSCRCGSATRRSASSASQPDRNGARSIPKRARCSTRCPSKPPRRWSAPRSRAIW